MTGVSSQRFTPRTLRVLASLLFVVISGALWVGFSVDTYFASDGVNYFVIILDHARFTEIAPARIHAEYLSQWPLVLGVRCGVTDLELLEFLFGLGLWFPWLLGFVISLYATRENPGLIFFYLISLTCLNLAAWSLLIGEHLVLLSLSWPILFLGILRRPLNVLEQVLVGVLLIAHLRLYESAVATGAVFAVVFGLRSWFGKSRRETWINGTFAALAVASVLIALRWILFPRDADNRTSFLAAMLGSLAHPYPWIGLSFVVLMFVGKLLQVRLMVKAAVIVPAIITLCSLAMPGVFAGIAFCTRTLSLSALPVLMVIAVICSFSKEGFERRLIGLASAIVITISLLHVRHLESWISFQSRFREVLASERGFVDPKDHNGLVHWGWTNPLLSYAWSEGKVECIILNPEGNTYEPFDARSEIVLESYLKEWPELVPRER